MLVPFGLDFGLRPTMALLFDTAFIENYRKAECGGLAYFNLADSKGNEEPYEFGFMMKNEKYAELFFDSLLGWQEKSGGDSNAIDMEFLEQKNGDYLLSFGPDLRLTIERMVPSHLKDYVIPMAIQAFQSKAGMRVSHSFRLFKDKYVKGRKVAVRYYIVDDNHRVRKKSERYFVKTEFKFSKEGELTGDSLYNPLINSELKKGKPPKKMMSGEDVITERMKKLGEFFPLAHMRFYEEDWVSEITKTINTRYSRDQVFQAICNILLFERLKRNDASKVKTDSAGYDLSLLEHLIETHESFDSYFPETSFFTKQSIEKQIRLDEKYFKTHSNK
ncbi:hypothetical protein EZ428_18640 [Pedobacter frigiditerrae]|uniref:Uncharacterized protein n=2 Tax=Pedobacter frigiditerrae TaxID=2530452 RepID=A0A4V2MI11_9SPHI|nr:hypothetical protein EZ428_18640 [Pedobacter frigiditerrae]